MGFRLKHELLHKAMIRQEFDFTTFGEELKGAFGTQFPLTYKKIKMQMQHIANKRSNVGNDVGACDALVRTLREQMHMPDVVPVLQACKSLQTYIEEVHAQRKLSISASYSGGSGSRSTARRLLSKVHSGSLSSSVTSSPVSKSRGFGVGTSTPQLSPVSKKRVVGPNASPLSLTPLLAAVSLARSVPSTPQSVPFLPPLSLQGEKDSGDRVSQFGAWIEKEKKMELECKKLEEQNKHLQEEVVRLEIVNKQFLTLHAQDQELYQVQLEEIKQLSEQVKTSDPQHSITNTSENASEVHKLKQMVQNLKEIYESSEKRRQLLEDQAAQIRVELVQKTTRITELVENFEVERRLWRLSHQRELQEKDLHIDKLEKEISELESQDRKHQQENRGRAVSSSITSSQTSSGSYNSEHYRRELDTIQRLEQRLEQSQKRAQAFERAFYEKLEQLSTLMEKLRPLETENEQSIANAMDWRKCLAALTSSSERQPVKSHGLEASAENLKLYEENAALQEKIEHLTELLSRQEEVQKAYGSQEPKETTSPPSAADQVSAPVSKVSELTVLIPSTSAVSPTSPPTIKTPSSLSPPDSQLGTWDAMQTEHKRACEELEQIKKENKTLQEQCQRVSEELKRVQESYQRSQDDLKRMQEELGNLKSILQNERTAMTQKSDEMQRVLQLDGLPVSESSSSAAASVTIIQNAVASAIPESQRPSVITPQFTQMIQAVCYNECRSEYRIGFAAGMKREKDRSHRARK